jgi:hypothetical protein
MIRNGEIGRTKQDARVHDKIFSSAFVGAPTSSSSPSLLCGFAVPGIRTCARFNGLDTVLWGGYACLIQKSTNVKMAVLYCTCTAIFDPGSVYPYVVRSKYLELAWTRQEKGSKQASAR